MLLLYKHLPMHVCKYAFSIIFMGIERETSRIATDDLRLIYRTYIKERKLTEGKKQIERRKNR